MQIFFLIAVLSFLQLTGCASHNALLDRDSNDVLNRLRWQHVDWKGVPYRYGGNSKKGIDCSGFVMLTFQQLFNQYLPRTTYQQVKQGKAVNVSQLRAGDLVFFKTGRTSRHVGMYLSNRQFLHASTSKGVIVSSLDNIYWRNRFWQARRILPRN